MAERSIRSGEFGLAMAVGSDKHSRGAISAKPSEHGIDDWYGETGLMLTTQFFALKIQRYMHEHGLSSSTLAKVARKALANGAEKRERLAAQPAHREQVLAAPPGCARSTKTSCSCAAQPEAGRYRARRALPSPMSTGRRGSAPAPS